MYMVNILNKSIEWLKDIQIANRGLHSIENKVPENTISAFEKAIENSVAIKLDVSMLKDDSIVVFHDNDLNRCCEKSVKIKGMCLKELKNVRLFNTDHKIPLLADALDYIDGRVHIIIQINDNVPARKICFKLLQILKNYKGKVAIESSNPFICLWLKKHAPEYTRGIIVSSYKKSKFLNKLSMSKFLFVPLFKPDFLSVDIKMLKNKRVKKAREKGYIVIGGVFRDKLEYIKYNNFCDSMLFDGKGEI